MHRIAAPSLAVALAAAAAFALVACGGEDAKLLPGATAAEIGENLDAVKQLASEGECVGAADAADQVGAQVEALTDVDPKLKQALERGAARLDEVVATCEEAEVEVAPPADRTEEERLPPGQAKKDEKEQEKEEKDREREERELEKEEEKAETQVPPEKESPPSEEAAPPSEGGGTGAGGVGPATPAPENE